MSQNELNKYKRMLEEKEQHLIVGVRNREDITVENTPDTVDAVQFAGHRNMAILNLDRKYNLLRSVRSALARIADGSYGVCLHCEEAIQPKRLDAVPWTQYCISCQQTADLDKFGTTAVDSTKRLVAAWIGQPRAAQPL
jgi:RNA polymerase-binding transcription factor